MEMYQKMYYHLFNAITDALEENDIEKNTCKSLTRNGRNIYFMGRKNKIKKF